MVNTWLNVIEAEKIYNSKYVGEFCINQTGNNWTDAPVAVFYQPVKVDPNHSNYIGIFLRDGRVYVTNAESTANIPIQAIESGGEIIYSRFRTDFVTSSDGLAFIDGGRDYARSSVDGRIIVAIFDGVIQVVDDPDFMFVASILAI
jgi:hypothetical protein